MWPVKIKCLPGPGLDSAAVTTEYSSNCNSFVADCYTIEFHFTKHYTNYWISLYKALRQLLDIHVSTVEKNDIKSLEIRFLKP